jgi:hypothetical protein
MPEAGKESQYEKVAFMGQVPVRVFGKVRAGDCILPSGYVNGIGKAVSPDNLKPEDYSKIIGIAWSDAEGDQLNTVNVAVGLNNNDAAKLVAKQASKITELENQISGIQTQVNHTNQLLSKLVPGFAEETGQPVTGIAQGIIPKPAPMGQVTVSNPSEQTIVYFSVTRDQILDGYTLAETMMKEKGVDLDTHPFFKKFRTEPGYKEQFISEMQQTVNKAIRVRAEMDAKSGSKVEVR